MLSRLISGSALFGSVKSVVLRPLAFRVQSAPAALRTTSFFSLSSKRWFGDGGAHKNDDDKILDLEDKRVRLEKLERAREEAIIGGAFQVPSIDAAIANLTNELATHVEPPTLQLTATEFPEISRLDFKNELSLQFFPPFMLLHTSVVDQIHKWLEFQPIQDSLTVTLTPKSGKTSVLFRVVPPLIHEYFPDSNPCVLLVDCSSLPVQHQIQGWETAARHHTFVQSFCSILHGKLHRSNLSVDLSVLPTDPYDQMREIFSRANDVGRPVFFLIDELQRFAQFDNKVLIEDTMNILKTAAIGLQNVKFCFSGSGMVLALSAVRLAHPNGRRFIDSMQFVDLDQPLTHKQAIWVADELLVAFKEAKGTLPDDLNSARLVQEVRRLSELRPSVMAWYLTQLPTHRWSLNGTVVGLRKKLAEEFYLDATPLLKDKKFPVELLKYLRELALHKRSDPPPITSPTGFVDIVYEDYVKILTSVIVKESGTQKYRLLFPYNSLIARAIDEDGLVRGFKFNTTDSWDAAFSTVGRASELIRNKSPSGKERRNLNMKLLEKLKNQFDSPFESWNDWKSFGGGCGKKLLDYPGNSRILEEFEGRKFQLDEMPIKTVHLLRNFLVAHVGENLDVHVEFVEENDMKFWEEFSCEVLDHFEV